MRGLASKNKNSLTKLESIFSLSLILPPADTELIFLF
jgi:hypothetical protein